MLCKSHPKVGIIIISIVLGIFVTIGYFIKSQGIYNVILKTVQDSSSLQIASPTSYSGSNTPISRAIPTTTPKPKKKLDGGYLFNLVNGYRAKNGLQQMTWWHQLCEYSKARSTQIQTDWSHAGFNKDAAEGKLRGEYCPECGKLGENLAKDYWTEEEILQAWIKSPDHKANLDDPLWNAGCAMVYNNNYISFEFGQRQ